MTHTPSAAPAPVFITAATNPLFKALTRLVQHPGDYRKQGQIWLEGDHLCRAALARGLRAQCAIFSSSLWQAGVAPELLQADKILVMADDLLAKISTLPSPASMGYLLDCTHLLPVASTINPCSNTVVLDRIQDAGNVGSILRSASAMGFKQILAIKGTAALWSPKVLRAGMGAHFDLQLFEGLHPSDLQQLQTPLLVTHLQGQQMLHQATLPHPCAWVLGHEGQGVQPALANMAHLLLRIAQPGGEESLNVAAAAAICLHSSVAAQQAQAGSNL